MRSDGDEGIVHDSSAGMTPRWDPATRNVLIAVRKPKSEKRSLHAAEGMRNCVMHGVLSTTIDVAKEGLTSRVVASSLNFAEMEVADQRMLVKLSPNRIS